MTGTAPQRVRVAAAVVLIGGLTGLTAWQCTVHRAAAEREQGWSDVAEVSADATVAILSYEPATVGPDTARATDLLTGDFRDFYTRYAAEVVAPESVSRGLSSAADVVGTSVVSVVDGEAVALVFANQTTASTDAPAPSTASIGVRIELEQVDGRWLVSKFDPV